jgi:sulfur carrier protein
MDGIGCYERGMRSNEGTSDFSGESMRALALECPWIVWITLNGDRHEIADPSGATVRMTVNDLLASLQIDARRVAVELNLVVLKRDAFASTMIHEGDAVEIVNFVGGG